MSEYWFSYVMFLVHDRWVYEGVIDDPYGEFLIDENKSLQKVYLFAIVDITSNSTDFVSL